MDINLTKGYWVEEALEALVVADNLFEKEDYSWQK